MKPIAILIEKVVNSGAQHCLYSAEGKWFHNLKKFPGVLFDKNGMLLFESSEEYINNPFLLHGKELNIKGGISGIPKYRFFNAAEKKKILFLFKSATDVDINKEWLNFLKAARLYHRAKEIYFSPILKRRYLITNIENNVVNIDRIGKPGSYETITIQKFSKYLREIKNEIFPVKINLISGTVTEITTLIELVSTLDWSEDGKMITASDTFKDRSKFGVPNEAPNDDISVKTTTYLKARRGQRKLRAKLFHLYDGKCAISQCAVSEVLHACHVDDFGFSGNNLSTNAILIRSDLHDLFDSHLLAIHPFSNNVVIHSSLKGTSYFEFHERKVAERNDNKKIDIKALNRRWDLFVKKR